MKWFKLEPEVLSDPVLIAFHQQFGDAGIGRLFRLWCAAMRTWHPASVGMVVDQRGHPSRVDDVALVLGVPLADLRALLAFLAERGHVDPRQWRRDRIRFPFLVSCADDYTKKTQRKRARAEVSGHSPDNVRTLSSQKRREEKRRDQKKKRSERARERDAGASPGADAPARADDRPPTRPTPPDPLTGFETFWASYPRKVGKQDAEKAWRALKPDAELCAVMLTALEHQKRSSQWTKDGGTFIPYPATWVNKKRWTDELAAPGASPTDPDPQRKDPPMKSGWLDDWDCPHSPHCNHRASCDRLKDIAEEKAKLLRERAAKDAREAVTKKGSAA